MAERPTEQRDELPGGPGSAAAELSGAAAVGRITRPSYIPAFKWAGMIAKSRGNDDRLRELVDAYPQPQPQTETETPPSPYQEHPAVQDAANTSEATAAQTQPAEAPAQPAPDDFVPPPVPTIAPSEAGSLEDRINALRQQIAEVEKTTDDDLATAPLYEEIAQLELQQFQADGVANDATLQQLNAEAAALQDEDASTHAEPAPQRMDATEYQRLVDAVRVQLSVGYSANAKAAVGHLPPEDAEAILAAAREELDQDSARNTDGESPAQPAGTNPLSSGEHETEDWPALPVEPSNTATVADSGHERDIDPLQPEDFTADSWQLVQDEVGKHFPLVAESLLIARGVEQDEAKRIVTELALRQAAESELASGNVVIVDETSTATLAGLGLPSLGSESNDAGLLRYVTALAQHTQGEDEATVQVNGTTYVLDTTTGRFRAENAEQAPVPDEESAPEDHWAQWRREVGAIDFSSFTTDELDRLATYVEEWDADQVHAQESGGQYYGFPTLQVEDIPPAFLTITSVREQIEALRRAEAEIEGRYGREGRILNARHTLFIGLTSAAREVIYHASPAVKADFLGTVAARVDQLDASSRQESDTVSRNETLIRQFGGTDADIDKAVASAKGDRELALAWLAARLTLRQAEEKRNAMDAAETAVLVRADADGQPQEETTKQLAQETQTPTEVFIGDIVALTQNEEQVLHWVYRNLGQGNPTQREQFVEALGVTAGNREELQTAFGELGQDLHVHGYSIATLRALMNNAEALGVTLPELTMDLTTSRVAMHEAIMQYIQPLFDAATQERIFATGSEANGLNYVLSAIKLDREKELGTSDSISHVALVAEALADLRLTHVDQFGRIEELYEEAHYVNQFETLDDASGRVDQVLSNIRTVLEAGEPNLLNSLARRALSGNSETEITNEQALQILNRVSDDLVVGPNELGVATRTLERFLTMIEGGELANMDRLRELGATYETIQRTGVPFVNRHQRLSYDYVNRADESVIPLNVIRRLLEDTSLGILSDEQRLDFAQTILGGREVADDRLITEAVRVVVGARIEADYRRTNVQVLQDLERYLDLSTFAQEAARLQGSETGAENTQETSLRVAQEIAVRKLNLAISALDLRGVLEADLAEYVTQIEDNLRTRGFIVGNHTEAAGILREAVGDIAIDPDTLRFREQVGTAFDTLYETLETQKSDRFDPVDRLWTSVTAQREHERTLHTEAYEDDTFDYLEEAESAIIELRLVNELIKPSSPLNLEQRFQLAQAIVGNAIPDQMAIQSAIAHAEAVIKYDDPHIEALAALEDIDFVRLAATLQAEQPGGPTAPTSGGSYPPVLGTFWTPQPGTFWGENAGDTVIEGEQLEPNVSAQTSDNGAGIDSTSLPAAEDLPGLNGANVAFTVDLTDPAQAEEFRRNERLALEQMLDDRFRREEGVSLEEHMGRIDDLRAWAESKGWAGEVDGNYNYASLYKTLIRTPHEESAFIAWVENAKATNTANLATLHESAEPAPAPTAHPARRRRWHQLLLAGGLFGNNFPQ